MFFHVNRYIGEYAKAQFGEENAETFSKFYKIGKAFGLRSYFSLMRGEFFIELYDGYFVPSATSEKKERIAEMIEEKREKTHCFLEPHPPEGLFNRRSYTNIEPLISVLEKICVDFEVEDDLLYKAYEAEAALSLSDYIIGFSHMKWYELPQYGWFPKEGVVTFQYIWMDISIMIGISFFVATFSVWWRHNYTD